MLRWFALALGVSLAAPVAVEAQMSATPASGSISAPAGSSGTITFTLRTDDPNIAQDEVGINCDGAVVSCTWEDDYNGGWVRIQSGSPVTVTIGYTVGGTTGTMGTIDVSFTDQWTGESADGAAEVTVQSSKPRITVDYPTWYTGENVPTNYPWFHVTNIGDTPATYAATVTCSNSATNCSVRAQPPSGIAPGASTDLIVDYQSGYAAAGNGVITLKVTSQFGDTASIPVTIVPSSDAVLVTPDNQPSTVQYNSSATLPFVVHETGNASAGFNYTVTASCGGAVVSCVFANGYATDTVPPNPGVDQSVPVTIHTVNAPAGGSGTVTVSASVTDGWGHPYQDQGSFNVTAPDVRSYTVAVSPASTTAYNEANVSTNYNYTLTNSGNTQATYTVTTPNCSGTATGCSFSASGSVTSTTVTVNPNGGTASVPVYFTTLGAGQNASITLQTVGPSNTASGSVTLVPQAPTVSVSGGGTVNLLTNRSGTMQFTVQNNGTSGAVTYNISYTCAAPISCSAPATVYVPQGQSAPVTLSFQTNGAVGAANVNLTATAPRPPFVNLYQSASSGVVNVTSSLAVSTAFMNNDDQDLSICAMACFAATVARSTVPFYTLDAPRSLTLVYQGDRAFPRPFVYADATLALGTPSDTAYLLEVRHNGVNLVFTNGETILHFRGAGTSTAPYRIAGQVDLTSYATGVYPVQVVVTALYANGTSDVTTASTQLLVVNTGRSPVAKGWTIAGLQHLSLNTEAGGDLAENGDGSATYFTGSGATGGTTAGSHLAPARGPARTSTGQRSCSMLLG